MSFHQATADNRRALEQFAPPFDAAQRSHRRAKAFVTDVGGSVRLVAGLLRSHRWRLATIVLAMAVETAMSLAAPWPLKIVIDNVVGSREPPAWLNRAAAMLPGHGPIAIAELAAFVSVVAAALGALASYVDDYTTERVGQGMANDLRLRLYHHLQHLSLAYHDAHQTGALISTMTSDVDVIEDFATSKAIDMVIDVMQIAGMVGLMLWLDWRLALVASAVAPFLLLHVARSRKAVKDATREVRRRQSDLVGVVQQGLQSVRLVHAFGRQDLEDERIAAASRAAVDAALKARRMKALVAPVATVVVSVCTAFVLWQGASLVVASAMTAGALTVFLTYLGKFFKPVQDLAKKNGAVAQAAIAMERIRGILDADVRTRERADAREPARLAGAISFEDVAFAYDGAPPVLRGLTFSIAPGDSVGIVGATGAGKSTLVSLISRFYDPTAGRVLIDGVDVRDYKLDALREWMGWVMQDTFLLRGTIRDNIAYGRPDATDEEIVEAARLANAHEFISRMPRGYDSQVAERGLTLSGGERQRIGIARAILRDAPILILDEPTAALDAESERLVIDALDRVTKGRTVITIAHRLSTVRHADRIIVLKDGRAAEQGAHDQLLALGGSYARLHLLQGGGGAAPRSGLVSVGA